jgi:hypothetical protein
MTITRIAIIAWLFAGAVSAGDSLCVGDDCIYYDSATDEESGELLTFTLDSSSVLTFDTPECPSGYGPIEIEVPESIGLGYTNITVECGRVR